ncbi:MAG: hypothetical protein ACOX0E_10870 [Syntrophomonadaceae bacterium]
MICISCRNSFDKSSYPCPLCGYEPANYSVLVKVYPPNDIIIESLLKSYSIPVRLIRKEVSQMPVAIGPLAEVTILIPEEYLEEAKKLLESDA